MSNLLISGKSVLAELGIELAVLKSSKLSFFQLSNYMAIITYLTKYKPKDGSNLEKVQNLLDAFDLLCQMEEFEKAIKVMAIPLDTPMAMQLHNQLQVWGYYQASIDLYEKFKDTEYADVYFTTLGDSYSHLNKYHEAIECWHQQLAYANSIDDWILAASTLNKIGNTCCQLGEFYKAIGYFQHSWTCLEILESMTNNSSIVDILDAETVNETALSSLKEAEILQTKCLILGNLANAYTELAEYKIALTYLNSCLSFTRKIGDSDGEARTLNNLGCICQYFGNHHQAFEYFQESLTIAQHLNYRLREAEALANIGSNYALLEKFEEQIQYSQQALTIFKEINHSQNVGAMLNNLASAYTVLKKYDEAFRHSKESLKISQTLGDRQGEVCALEKLGHIRADLKEYHEATEYYEQSLVIAREMKNVFYELKILLNFGVVLINLEKFKQAQDNWQTGLEIAERIGVVDDQARLLKNLAILQRILGDRKLAHEYIDRALVLATELDIPLAQECQVFKDTLLREES